MESNVLLLIRPFQRENQGLTDRWEVSLETVRVEQAEDERVARTRHSNLKDENSSNLEATKSRRMRRTRIFLLEENVGLAS